MTPPPGRPLWQPTSKVDSPGVHPKGGPTEWRQDERSQPAQAGIKRKWQEPALPPEDDAEEPVEESWKKSDWKSQRRDRHSNDWNDRSWKGKSWKERDWQEEPASEEHWEEAAKQQPDPGGDWKPAPRVVAPCERERDRKKEKKEKKESKQEKKERKRREKNMPDRLDGENWEEPKESVGLVLVKDMAPEYDWEYPFYEDSRRSYAGYLKSPMSKQRCRVLFNQIEEGTEWLQPQTSTAVMPRKTAWLVKRGCSCTYSYGPFQVPPAEYPPWMIELMQEVMPYCGLESEDDWPNCCNMNLYEDGGAAVGWHSDDESLFQGKFTDILIISLSFGVTRTFELRYNWPDDDKEQVHRFMLGSGDLMTMEGMTQKHMQHRVPKEDNVAAPRINLTWRWVVKHTPKCPAGRCRR